MGYSSTSLILPSCCNMFLYSSSLPSLASLVFSLPFYSFSYSFLFLKKPTRGTKPYLLFCLLFALSDICHTSTSPSPLSQDFTLAQSALLAFLFCPSDHSTPLPSLHLQLLEDTHQIFPTGLSSLNVHTSWIPLSESPSAASVSYRDLCFSSHSTPYSHTGAALTIPVTFYLLLSSISALFPSEELPASQPAPPYQPSSVISADSSFPHNFSYSSS